MKPYTNNDRWRHIKHFVDTHPYSEDNLDYLKNWLEQFTTESMTTKAENLEKCSHWKPEDNNGKQKIPYGNNSIPRTKKTPDESTYLEVKEAEVTKEFINTGASSEIITGNYVMIK